MTLVGAPSRLLPAPAPPHDPYSVMLAGHIGPSPSVGWRVRRTTRIDLARGNGALVLSPAPAASRWLSEPSGSFGGLRPPSNVALTSTGDVLLLDAATGELRRFDPCACRFVTVPCAARLETTCAACEAPSGPSRIAAPRDRLSDPQGIAVCAGDLFIADRGHHRILRYAIGSWIPRGILRLPLQQRLAMGGAEWSPTGLAVDGAGRLLISDAFNGRLDRFTTRGSWIDTVVLDPGATHVAVDCDDTPYVVIERDLVQPVTVVATGPVTLELAGGSDGFQWHALGLAPLIAGLRAKIDVHAGDAPWTSAHRNDPNNAEWSGWLSADALGTAAGRLPLGGREGRFLRIRLTPVGGPLPATLDATARGARVVRIVGGAIETVNPARADLVERFGRPRVMVDRAGRLHLFCEDGVHAFDVRGDPVADDAPRGDAFEREGRYWSSAIDARIEACQWHRIELRGAIPSGCSVEVLATTAEIELSPEELDGLPPTSWISVEPARSMRPAEKWSTTSCSWDALIPAQPGRYLWLQLVLRGEGRDSPCVSAAVVEYPRISFLRYLPGVFAVDPAGADFTDRFTAVFDRTLRTIESRLDRLALNFDPLSAPAETVPGHQDFLTWIGGWIGISLARDWPEERRRRYLKDAARLYCQRGTPEGLRRQLLLLLGFDTASGDHCLAERPQCRCLPRAANCAACPPCQPAEPPPLVLEHFKLRRWLYTGHGRLGSDSELWGKAIVGRSELGNTSRSAPGDAQIGVTTLNTVPDPLRDPFHVHAHAFSVFVPARVRDNAAERRALERLLALESPAHTKVDIRYVEPRYRVGVQASIGLDGVIARTPSGVTLDASRLRQGTVLSGQPFGPHLRVDDSRVGVTTRLT